MYGILTHQLKEESPTNIMDDDRELDIVSLVESAYDTDTKTVRDLKIDDRDLKKAKNYFDFCVSYLGPTAKVPFARQLWMGTHLLGEACPRCSNPKWADIHNVPVDYPTREMAEHIMFMEDGKCPKCKATKAQLVKKDLMNVYTELDVCAGQRSGKSAFTASLATYITHLHLKNPRLSAICDGIQESTPLTATFVGIRFDDAYKLLWTPIVEIIDASPWFGEYHALLNDYGFRYGREFLKKRDVYIRYAHKNLDLFPMSSNKRALRGRTRFLGCFDKNTLVSTSNGLKRIHKDLYDETVHVGKNHFRVLDWIPTGYKDCLGLRLKTGQSIIGTLNQEIKTLRGWVRLDTLTVNDKVAVSLGGNFPRSLKLTFQPTCESKFAKIYRTIQDLKKFELKDLKGLGRSVTPITSYLRRTGYLNRYYYKGRTGLDGRCRCYYKIVPGFNANRLIADAINSSKFCSRNYAKFPTRMTENLASILGYMIADGSYNKGASEFFFGSSVRSRLDHFNRCYTSIFGIPLKSVRYKTLNGTQMYRFSISYSIVKDYFRYLGLDAVGSKNKQVPWSILEAPKACVAAFLAALYDCDGGASKHYIYYSTISFRLAKQIQIILQRFGILSYLKVPKKLREGKLNKLYVVRIREKRYQAIFNREIGFSTNPIMDIVKRDYYSKYLPDSLGLVWVDVQKIIPVGKRHVYDIKVDDEDHGFTADGIVAHNCVDEIGWFPLNPNAKADDDAGDGNSDRERADGEEVYVALDRSMLTVRAEVHKLIYEKGISSVPTAINILVSSPASAKDKISRLVEQNKNSRTALAIHLPTWEMNPNLPESHPAIRKAYMDNPSRAERDYGAKPPKSTSPFMTNTDIQRCFTGMNRATLQNVEAILHGKRFRGAKLSKVFPENEMPPSIMSLDAGYSNNAFAVTIQYREGLKAIVPVTVEVQPSQDTVLHYNAIWKGVIVPLIQAFNVKLLLADRWQSLSMLHRAMSELNIKAAVYSVKRRDFDLVKSMMDTSEIMLPKLEAEISDDVAIMDYPSAFHGKPAAHLLFQCFTVKDLGKTIAKGDGYTDDLFRALVLGVSRLYDPKVEEYLKSQLVKKRDKVALGSVYGLAAGNLQTARGRTLKPIPKIASLGRFS